MISKVERKKIIKVKMSDKENRSDGQASEEI